VRHRLTPWLLDQGGHIGYSVRPSRRREGHASRALALAVRRAAELGLDRVLVTCDDDNEGSRRTIEAAGGVHEDTRGVKRRYWIDTAAGG
jgi:predicted acetyltransferase